MSSAFSFVSHRTIVSAAARSFAIVLLAACSATSDSVTTPTGPGAPSRLELSTNGIALDSIGAAADIAVSLRDADGNAVSGQLSWKSDNPNIAEVSANGAAGKVTGRAAGVTIIHVSYGALTKDLEVRVLGVRSVSLVQSTVALRAGDVQLLGALIDADVNTKMDLQFTAANPSVATVDASGVVSGIRAGTTTVRVSSKADSRIAATATITVNPARTVSFAPGGSALTLWAGDARSLSVNVDVDEFESHDIVWTSENPSVATISESGVITATSTGTAIIRARSAADPRASAEMVLTVLPARSVTVAPDTATLAAGAELQLAATVVIEAGNSTDVSWSSSDTTVATVSSSGLVTAVGGGSAMITATSAADATRSGTAMVHVLSASGLKTSARIRKAGDK